ncbi:S8 family peptidase [Novosphingobium sp. Gsoil 351]|uniref:S8 family peptidase n=1 Tax=Novosphingobium sp. Gsoil 351 TaxID=2675225 RepID=UPI001E2B6622|nr:S8 family peptidase [Novosphingobium sp. Gsoil 351]
MSDGPALHRVIPAWTAGATGKGVTVAIVDTGIDPANPEFAGRISAASADVAGNRGITPEDDHGTQIALIAAAARNGSGILGIAFDATIQALRIDAPGTCAQTAGCKFTDDAIAAGVNRAVDAGARVINLSIGGSNINATLRSAIARAASAGVVVVVAAGNDGDSTDPAVNKNEPDPFASSTATAGNGNVIIAGSVDSSGTISAFANRAGSFANVYLNALGEDVCCVYQNGQIRITNRNGSQFVTVVSGTSFSTPQIVGAVALLAQAFPNLTGQQIVDLLLRTARDGGAAGTDPIYGRGTLDIANAFAPQGTMTLAGSTALVPLGDTMVVTSGAMGDAGTKGTLGAVILDGYSRAYAVDFARQLRDAVVQPRLSNALAGQTRTLAAGNDRFALGFTVDGRGGIAALAPLRLGRDDAEQARVLAASVTARLAPGRQVAFGFRQGADGLAAQLSGARSPAFFIAGAPGDDLGFVTGERTAVALRQMLGGFGLTLSGERGQALTGPERHVGELRLRRENEPMERFGLAVDRRFGEIDAALGASWLREDRTVLGARFHDALGRGGADSAFVDARVGWSVRPDVRLGASWRGGATMPRGGGAIVGGRLLSQALAVDLEKLAVFAKGDRLAIRIAQPLRVESGGVRLNLPVDYDYATLSPTFASSTYALTPSGRELIGELAWRGELWGGDAAASVFYRKDPGHFASLPDDKGVAVKWGRGVLTSFPSLLGEALDSGPGFHRKPPRSFGQRADPLAHRLGMRG